jgi:hypothetical protein
MLHTYTLPRCRPVPGRCGCARARLTRWRCSRWACPALSRSLAYTAGVGTRCARSARGSLPSTLTPPANSSGGSSPARRRCEGSASPCCRQRPMGGRKTSTRWGRRGCWRSGPCLQPQPREARVSPCLSTSKSPGLSGWRSWSWTAASHARPPSAWHGWGSRPQAQRREAGAGQAAPAGLE